jgi:hypothetical protein
MRPEIKIIYLLIMSIKNLSIFQMSALLTREYCIYLICSMNEKKIN